MAPLPPRTLLETARTRSAKTELNPRPESGRLRANRFAPLQTVDPLKPGKFTRSRRQAGRVRAQARPSFALLDRAFQGLRGKPRRKGPFLSRRPNPKGRTTPRRRNPKWAIVQNVARKVSMTLFAQPASALQRRKNPNSGGTPTRWRPRQRILPCASANCS